MNTSTNERRRFLRTAGLVGLAALISPVATGRTLSTSTTTPIQPPAVFPTPAHSGIIKPRRLQPGAMVGLASPAGALHDHAYLRKTRKKLEALGLRTKVAPHALKRRGYLAGTDAERAADLHALFADPSVDAILAVRGGWGAGRLLPLLDYDLIRQNPKILIGYSDITSLLIALYACCDLVTFHGPVGTSPWNAFTLEAFRCVLFDGDCARLDPAQEMKAASNVRSQVHTITPGTAQGRLVGGNLTVLASIIGSGFLPDWRGHILFFEDTNEPTYRVDRMLTQLRLAGVLDQVAGIVFGKCTNCAVTSDNTTLSLNDVLADHLRPLGIPAWSGAMIGHIAEHYTLPLGTSVEIDATAGTIDMLEPAVV